MRVGALKIDLEITDSNSLKDKRMVLRGLKERIRRRFNVSVSEVGYNDKWQRTTLGIAATSNDKQFISKMLNKVLHYIEKERTVVVLDVQMEIL
ncbi:MAG: DUF503 domain-containing protein [Candidatus Omnitrophica bacterium]|nr:DUF503 domain-containing protein [Candidatus Omnitrophota bacterium]